MDEIELRNLLAVAKFKFAKSMPKIPHYYTLRETWDDATFADAVLAIRNYGVPRKFGNRMYIYYDFDGYTYWTMGDTIENTILINRALREAAQ